MSSLTIYLAMLMLGSNFSSTAAAEQPQQAYTMQQVAQSVEMMPVASIPVPPPLAVEQNTVPQPVPFQVEQSEVRKAPQVRKSNQLTEEEQRYVDLVNHERMLKGMRALKVDPLLVEVSRQHSKEMCDENYFDHISPTPGKRTALDRYLAAAKRRPVWMLIGENLFYCSKVDINRGHTCLMESKSHRDNILNPRFERIGVGIHKSETGEFWVTEMFLSSID